MPEKHSSSCDWDAYELCTCGVKAREQQVEGERNRVEYERQREVERILLRREERRWRIKRFLMKLGFFSFLGILAIPLPWVSGLIFFLWLIPISLFWLVEAHAPLYSDPHLRGIGGYLKFVLW